MDSGSQSGSGSGGGGGGLHGGSAAGSSSALHDNGRPLQSADGSVDSGLNSGQRSQTPPLLSLDQIRTTGSSNEYTDGPTGAPRKTDLVGTLEERRQNLHNLRSLALHENTSSSSSSREDSLQSSSVGVTPGAIGTSEGSANSVPANGDQIIRVQPKRSEPNSEELKPLNEAGRVVGVTPGSSAAADGGKHADKCGECQRCRCANCSRPRALPSCWMCGRRCVCSANSAVDHLTCACCVKGLFYHCSSDDEDTCSDKPFSCSQLHCCARWATVSLLSLVFPCLLCYLPAKACAAACQLCYDRATRPGCRCKDSASAARHHHKMDTPT
ncbi:protein sprouty homolog 2 [Kryptolebias marmoratus]|uniref:protein sprouty homolog 2 n=1 Tax=Kryptolebias marmoratus TaxID=37003 RepID=UPI0007F87CDD|nr:protein sprouty homolog 2 [Kryptolebias marmoratus]